MPTDETHFVFPARPEDAIVRLTITVEPGDGDTLTVSALVTPGCQAWRSKTILRDAGLVPLVGNYVLEVSANDTRLVSHPGLTDEDKLCLVLTLQSEMRQGYHQLVQGLRAFPPIEVIEQAARRIVGGIHAGSLGRSAMRSIPVVDARTVEVAGVNCVVCDFMRYEDVFSLAVSVILAAEASGDAGVDQVDHLQFTIREDNGVPVVLVGYLDHENGFAAFLNGVLADRIRAAVQAVAVEVATKFLVNSELRRRLLERFDNSILATYQVATALIASHVDALEAERDDDGIVVVIDDDDQGEPVSIPVD